MAGGKPVACNFASSTDVLACKKQCFENNSSREVRDFHEFKAVQWTSQMNRQQIQQAQLVVDRVLRSLLFGVRVHCRSQEARLLVTEDLKTLEFAQGDGSGETLRQRIPLSQVVDASFGAGGKTLVLRFSDALAKDPIELMFYSEKERVEVALTLKVLRARLA